MSTENPKQISERDRKFLIIINIFSITVLTILLFVPDADASYHHVGVVGDFEGKYDHKSIIAQGEYKVSDDVNEFTLRGDFEKDGRDWTYNINCITVIGKLTLDSQETEVYLDFDGKKCEYGYMSYVIGTFETTGAIGKYSGVEGEGRMTFFTNHYSDNVSGTLQGKFKV